MTFDPDTLARISLSLRAGHYNLLLGAGVSLDSTNHSGTFLPTSNEFRLDLCRLKGARESSSLQRVYSTLTEQEIRDSVVDRFRGCRPGPTLKMLTKFLWKRIFSLNIDDALENAYSSPNRQQKASPYHFSAEYTEARELSTVPIIHLHGWVTQAEKGFVFSRAEYVRLMKEMNPWMVVLTQFLPTEPFIIAGTALDEVDIDYYLSFRSTISSRDDRGPSIFIEPNADSITLADCEKYNLLLYRGTAAAFFEYVDKTVPARPRAIELLPQNSREIFPASVRATRVLSFFSDFECVPTTNISLDNDYRFLYGHVPSWSDLSRNLDIGRTVAARIQSRIMQSLRIHGGSKEIMILIDDTGSGKTTIVRRIAFDLARDGVCVLLCSALSRIDSQFTAEMLDAIDRRTLIIVDNFAEQVSAIVDISQRVRKHDIVILAAERRYRIAYLKQALAGHDHKFVQGLKLKPVHAERLIDRYAEFGLLGTSAATVDRKNFVAAISNDPIAVSCCRILNDFRPLDRIIASLVRETNKVDYKRYLTAALAQHCFRGGVRYEVLAAIAGREGWDDQMKSDHPMPLAFFEDGEKNYIVPMNGTVASRVLQRTIDSDSDLMFTVFLELGGAIAPRVSRTSVQRRTPEARLAGRLFDFDQVVFGHLKDKANLFYERMKPLWKWNSRYWEQVALLHLSRFSRAPNSPEGRDGLELAIQHARHAVAIEFHPHPLTTLGKILLAHIPVAGASREPVYAEAFSKLSRAISLERSWSRSNIHPFISLFRGTCEYIAVGGRITSRQADELRALTIEARHKFPKDQQMEEIIADLNSAMS